MFGKLLNYEQKNQTLTLHYEKQTAQIQVITDKIINVFVPYHTTDHRSKAVEGKKECPVSFTVNKTDDALTITTDFLICKIHDNFMIDFYDKKGALLCADYRGKRFLYFKTGNSFSTIVGAEKRSLFIIKINHKVIVNFAD